MDTRLFQDSIIGDWTVRPALNRIERGDEHKMLQPQSMNVLCYLAARAGEVVTSDALLAEFWVGRHIGDDAVHRRIADLRRQLEDHAREPRYIQTITRRGYRLIAPVRSPPEVPASSPPPRSKPRYPLLLGALAAAGVIAATLWTWHGHLEEDRFEAALNSAGSLLAEDRHGDAYRHLAPWLGRVSDPRLTELLNAASLPVSVLTEPPGVSVWLTTAEPAGSWQLLGITPIRDLRLPRGNHKFRLGEQVFLDASNPGPVLNSAGLPEHIVVMPANPVPAGMVYVPPGEFRLGAWSFSEAVDLGGYLMDRTEVTNDAYQAFVDAGGYTDEALWTPIIAASAGTLTWQTIRETFVDSTGRAGPAGWELGAFPSGSADLPVTGVSWFEALAYLHHVGKTLPAAQHWLRAALGPMEWKYPVAARLVPHSNLAGTRLEPVGSRALAEHHGAFDLIGNAREWTSGHNGALKIVMGSGFRDPAWQYSFPVGLDPLARQADLGFRGIRLTDQSRAVGDEHVELFNQLQAPIRRVSDEVFEGMSYQYAYTPGTLRAADVTQLDEQPQEHWIRRRLLIPSGRAGDPLPVSIFLPRRSVPPYQSVLFLPPADSWAPGFRTEDARIENYQLDMIPRSGRALIWPVYAGSHERYDGFHAAAGPERSKLALERNRRIRDEIGRVLDYLTEDTEFDGERVGLVGLSFGAMLAAYPLAVEPRLKAAVLYSVGIATPNPVFANPQNDPNIFWARVSQPLLVINGRFDPIRPHHFIIEPFLALLATPAADKRSVLLDAAHWPLPREPLMRETLGWFDRYLGPVAGSAAPVGPGAITVAGTTEAEKR